MNNLYKVVLMRKDLEVVQGISMPTGGTYIVNVAAPDMTTLVEKVVSHILPEHKDMRILSIKETVTNIR